MGPEHPLIDLIEEPDGLTPGAVRQKVMKAVGRTPPHRRYHLERIPEIGRGFGAAFQPVLIAEPTGERRSFEGLRDRFEA